MQLYKKNFYKWKCRTRKTDLKYLREKVKDNKKIDTILRLFKNNTN